MKWIKQHYEGERKIVSDESCQSFCNILIYSDMWYRICKIVKFTQYQLQNDPIYIYKYVYKNSHSVIRKLAFFYAVIFTNVNNKH